ncbi:ATP-dependent DNA helicase [Burkholderiales bacterium]|nr:ATP-dependent DNA helicase [Burkholderiales bacterium]
MSTQEEIDRAFNSNGLLSEVVAGYKARIEQSEMAQAIGSAIKRKEPIICEAGTGTGKTFAYLIPAFYYGRKIIIATGTKTLQDQLFDQDIQVVRSALKIPITVAKLKGRANYLCHHQIERTKSERSFSNLREVELFNMYERMLDSSKSGDISEVNMPEENPRVQSSVVSTRDNCLGSDCLHINKCFVLKARKKALAAEVVVVNHHLFFADLALKQDGFGELLPDCDVVIFDEAHQVGDVATQFFGSSVSTNQLNELLRDLRYATVIMGDSVEIVDDLIGSFEKGIRDLRLSFEGLKGRYDLRERDRFSKAVESSSVLAGIAKDLAECVGSVKLINVELQRCRERLLEAVSFLVIWSKYDEHSVIRWFESSIQSVRMHLTPIDVSEEFKSVVMAGERSWIFTSATLSVSGDASYFTQQLGLEDALFKSWDSPFDYSQNSVLYVPKDMPQPAQASYVERVIDESIDAICAAKGRCMMLFTSLAAMRAAGDRLSTSLKERNVEIPLLIQGDGSKFELLNQFKKIKNAVLLGSHSFWEGVDVRGEGLVLVVIDKLPFSVPDDPVTAGRIDYLRSKGGNPFMDFQVPEAVISLKQGAGRLIRDETDLGVLIICDPRLLSKPYGKKIWKSLPPMRRTQELSDVISFLKTA